jgi:exonuclease III
VVPVYAPHAENKTTEEIQIFYDQLSDVTDGRKKRGREIIMGGDFNASVGTRVECCNEEERRAIGPHGVNQRNLCAPGDMVINMAMATDLQK